MKSSDGTQLAAAYHKGSDGGAVISKSGGGGYYYVSNSEIGDYSGDFDPAADRTKYQDLTGGVYSIEFNANNELVGYKQVLSKTAKNCAGGATPWGSWVSCEEAKKWGQCWQGEFFFFQCALLMHLTDSSRFWSLPFTTVDPTGTIPARPTNVTGTFVSKNGM